MEDIEVILEEPETTEAEMVEEVVTLVREYKAGDYINIEDNTIHCTYRYQLPSSVVMDSKYVHTDNNFTNEEKTKLAGLENADLSDYYTKSQTDQAIAGSHENYYTKQETRTMILQDLESYYTKEEVDTALADHYTKAETDEKLGNHYTKAEADNAISSAVNSSSTSTKEDVLDEVADNYYNKTQVDSMIASGGGGGGASTAAEVSIIDASGYFTSTNVEGALQELGAELVGLSSAVSMQGMVVT